MVRCWILNKVFLFSFLSFIKHLNGNIDIMDPFLPFSIRAKHIKVFDCVWIVAIGFVV